MQSKLEEALAQQLAFASSDVNGRWRYPAPVREHRPFWCCAHHKARHHAFGGLTPWCDRCELPHEFKRGRDFRVDFAWPEQKVIVECEGIRYDAQGGRHQTGAGFARDLEKYTALELAGWRVVRVGQRQITSGEALSLIEKALREAVS
jgi:hypothetical protein